MIKQLTLVLFLAFALGAAAQTTNDTFTLSGGGCDPVYPQGCFIGPNNESKAPWVAPQPEFPVPPAQPMFYPSAIANLTTGLAIPGSARPLSQFPTHAVGTGQGTFNWFNGGGGSGSFTVTLNCTWDGYGVYTEICSGRKEDTGESVTFTRKWWATEGRFAFWNLHLLGGQSTMTLVDQSTVVILDKDQNNPFRPTVTTAGFQWPNWLHWLFDQSEPVTIFF